MDAVVGALSEPVNIHSPRGNQVTEAWKNNYKYAPRSQGHSSGRHYTDAHGVRHDDEGYSSDGNGPADRREREMHKAAPKPAATKHYHEVPYAKKEDAKAEGMKWHAEKKKWYHTDAAKSATSKFKKLHEDAEQLDEAAITVRDNLGDKTTLTGKKVGKNPHGYTVHAGSTRYHRTGGSGKAHNVWVMHGDKLIASHSTNDEHVHKKAIAHAKTSSHFWSHHEPHKDFYLHNHDEPKLVKEGTEDELNEELRERLAANAAANKDRVPVATGDGVKIKTHRVGVSVSDPNHEMASKRKEQQLRFIRVKSSSPTHAISAAKEHYKKHGYNVHDAYHHSTLDEALQEDFLEEENGHATRKAAEGRLEALEKKHPLAKHSVIQGRRTGRWHVVRHTSVGQHIVESVDELLNENEDHDYVSWAASDGTANSLHDLHKDHQKKVKAFVKSSHWKEVDKKHTDPKTGEKHVGGHVDDDTMHAFHKWHKETHGTEHKPFHSLTEDCGLDSKGDWKSYKSKADKKKSDGIDDDGGDKKPKDNIKEGDESEADYQAYLKTLKGNKDKKLSTIKSVRGGK
jgi:hypothetical protein